ncbi:MAG: isoprenylcysteine carboxylmethyltransferase family protein [Ardenticatenaceae bacterium]|nr:isoprenylcysteine carboxylmethyltransferase family protein [Anaerolineales bacterium]MCB8923376.1 isoprenylcysteine carboxylmethyltransferase family protein [Ardenticatenaceae bacterium]
MIEAWLVILIHQIVFQGMFVIKNVALKKKFGKPIRGNNKEANLSIALFVVFIAVSLLISMWKQPIGEVLILSKSLSMILGLVLLFLNLVISAASLVGLKDSWRVGVLEEQKTELISSGIYRFTRNPYFLSYLVMFMAYTVILQNIMLLVLAILAFLLIHKMILREEEYLYSVHGADYIQYKQKVPRYCCDDLFKSS